MAKKTRVVVRNVTVKVQRAIIASCGRPHLIYDKNHRILVQQEYTKEIEDLFDPGEYKIFARAEVHSDGTLAIGPRVRPQSW